ncbi:MAG TPA: YceI family protein [Microbacteriaceae bacterium]|nr:YceI family protein [Microbacteriaceae bacterium]
MSISTATIPDYITGTWTIDPLHSHVSFSVSHLAISKVRGSFEKFEGTIVTAENPLDSIITATVDMASVTTNQPDRDAHLRTSDFFAVADFPTMDFVSTGIRTEGVTFYIDGNLTLRGVTKPLTLKGQFGGITTDGFGQLKAGASASTTIDRTDFGVSFNQALDAGGFMIGNEIAINLDIQVILES